MGFALDTSKPAPGPYRMPRDGERRCRIYLEKPFRDCVDLCEVHPDLEERTDATMRLLASSWEMRQILHDITCDSDLTDHTIFKEATRLLTFIEKG